MNAARADLIKISHAVGDQIDLIQGGGGNTSVKDGNRMYIKASGTPLRTMSEARGWVSLPNNVSDQRPSMEWPMHQLLPRVVIHVHAVYANVYLCQKNGMDKLHEQLKKFIPIMIPYTTPGHELASVIAQKIEGETSQLLLLENHGLIVCGDDTDEVLVRLNSINTVLKKDMPTFVVENDPPILPSVFPDAAVFTGTTEQTTGVKEILSANHYLHITITAMGGIVQPLPDGEGEKLRALETEQYRMQQVCK